MSVMSEELAISLRGVSKCFKRYDRPVDRLKELLDSGEESGTGAGVLGAAGY